jgi:hypothetical protein
VKLLGLGQNFSVRAHEPFSTLAAPVSWCPPRLYRVCGTLIQLRNLAGRAALATALPDVVAMQTAKLWRDRACETEIQGWRSVFAPDRPRGGGRAGGTRPEGEVMRTAWAGLFSLALGLLPVSVSYAQEGESDFAVDTQPRTAAPAVALGRPVAWAPARDAGVAPVSYSPDAATSPLAAPQPIVRAQAPPPPDPILGGPTLAPPPAPPFPTVPGAPQEQFNCGVVNQPPAGGHGFFSSVGNACGSYCKFQSDQCFQNFISPVTNPFLFEDPRALTELRPIFIYQQTPTSNPIYHGGDIEYFGTQARLAVTERLSFVLSKFGWIWDEPHNHIDDFVPHDGFAEVWLGPKYTFLRNEQCGRIAAAGLNFQIPVGETKVFQDTGTLSLEPYVSFGQNFGRSSYGSFDFLTTLGYDFSIDNKRSDYFFTSLHLDYDIAGLHKIYPLVELNWFHYTIGGHTRDVGFEGGDLFNFGSGGVNGKNVVSIAPGLRYKVSEHLQFGGAAEFPLTGGERDLLGYRLVFDVILRY